MQHWKFIREGKEEKVELERWAWGVIYEDGSELHQFGQDGVFHQVGEIDQAKVRLFVMYKPADENRRIDVVMPKGAKLIHKYRNVKPFYLANFVRVYMFGWKKGSEYYYNFILPDDRIVQADHDNIDLTLFELNRK